MENKKKNIQQINIELDENVSSGEYANFVAYLLNGAKNLSDLQTTFYTTGEITPPTPPTTEITPPTPPTH